MNTSIINIETTNICPAHCICCPRESFTQKLESMDMSLFRKIIDDSVKYNFETYDLCGFGEPFADKNFIKKCEYIKEKAPNSKIYASTNCYLMDDRYYEDICKYIDILKISFYGINEVTYEKIHRLNIDRSWRNLEGFWSYKSNKKPHMVGLLVLLEENKNEIVRWKRVFEFMMDEVMIWKPHSWAGLKEYRTINRDKQVSCGRPINGPLYVHADGTVSPCCWDINKNLKIGDMRYQSIEEIYGSNLYKFYKTKHKQNNFSNLICENCDQTNPDPTNLIYSSNKNRKVGQLTPTGKEI